MAQNDLIVSVLSSPCSSYCVEGVVCSVPITFVIDTGAAVSLINNCVWNQITRAGPGDMWQNCINGLATDWWVLTGPHCLRKGLALLILSLGIRSLVQH